MKFFILILILCFSQATFAEEKFDYKIYTPQVIVDHQNHGKKGAVQLLWQKTNELTRYEIEVSNGNSTYSGVDSKNFHHVMLYFNKDYQWRVREVSAMHTTEFSAWMPLKVVPASSKLANNNWKREPVSTKESSVDADEFILDIGE